MRKTQTATIEETEEENDYEREYPCVYATCDRSGLTVGPIWGTGTDSRKRALAQLTEECSCGATWHEE